MFGKTLQSTLPNLCTTFTQMPDVARQAAGTMKSRFQQMGRGRKGFGTLEVVIIIAVILSIALLFRKTLSAYATNLINTVFAGDPLAN